MTAASHRLIRGGVIVDGTGSSRRGADLLVSGGRIESVLSPGSVDPRDCEEVLDADELIVAPGFIDPHSHADESPLLALDDTTRILQGITTEVVGNCGLSPDPPGDGDFAGYFRRLDDSGYVTNYCPLVGHGTIRRLAMGMGAGRPDGRQVRRMAWLLDEAIDAGAWGLSSGLIYRPGLFSDADEMVELARRLPGHAIYATHMRDEGRHLRRSVVEALDVARRSGARLQISHLKAAGLPFWGTVDDALDEIHAARLQGVAVNQDVYPYDASSTELLACLPPWFKEGDQDAVRRRLTDPAALRRARRDVEDGTDDSWENIVAGDGYDRIVVACTPSHEYEGESLAEIASHAGAEPFDVIVQLLAREGLSVTMVDFSMDEADMLRVLKDERTCVCTDGQSAPDGGGRPHPRLSGSFPRVLGRYVRERGELGLEQAIHKMTGLTADVFGLRGRGRIEAGAMADLVIFDPKTVTDRATYHDPLRRPDGIRVVMQAGMIVVRDGEWQGTRAGARLAPGQR